jgi:AmmeMemoRadiSam system protein B
MEIRSPAVAGQFYPASPAALKKMLEKLCVPEAGAKKEEAIGVICPHAGYIYSGPVAGACFAQLEFKDNFILLGPNHTGIGKQFSLMSSGSWQLPMGKIEINAALAKEILANTSLLKEDLRAHQAEHSLEVQVPFIQYFQPQTKIVPIILADAELAQYLEIGKAIAQAIIRLKASTVILASSDMTHYEPHDVAKAKDAKAIEAILRLDEKGLLQAIAQYQITMCGWAPVVCLLSAAKELGAKKAKLVKYQTSGDTSGDYSSVVGYAGIFVN